MQIYVLFSDFANLKHIINERILHHLQLCGIEVWFEAKWKSIDGERLCFLSAFVGMLFFRCLVGYYLVNHLIVLFHTFYLLFSKTHI